jgi:hypothetical protein
MSIQNTLNFSFALSDDSAAEQSRLTKLIDSINAEEASILQAIEELKSTDDADWTPAHSKAATKLRERQVELLHDEIGVRDAIGKFFSTVQTVDYPPARRAAYQAELAARDAATEYLVAGGWVNGRIEDSSGAAINGIDNAMICRNTKVREAMLANQSLSSFNLHDAREMNDKAITAAKEKFAKVKAKAMSLSA